MSEEYEETYDDSANFEDYEVGSTNYLADREVKKDYSQYLEIDKQRPTPKLDEFVPVGLRIDGRQPYSIHSQGYLQLTKPYRLLDENIQPIVFTD
jgi:hypothetical protein